MYECNIYKYFNGTKFGTVFNHVTFYNSMCKCLIKNGSTIEGDKNFQELSIFETYFYFLIRKRFVFRAFNRKICK